MRLVEANAALIASLVQALQGVRPAPAPIPLQRFSGDPESPGDPTVDEWLSDFDVSVRQCGVPVVRAGGERWCWSTILEGVRGRRCYAGREVSFVRIHLL